MHPWPQVAAELGVLEKSRELIEGTSMRELQQEFNKVCDVALLGVMRHTAGRTKPTEPLLASISCPQ